MRKALLWLSLLVLGLGVSCQAPAQPPPPLAKILEIQGVAVGMSSKRVEELLGPALQVRGDGAWVSYGSQGPEIFFSESSSGEAREIRGTVLSQAGRVLLKAGDDVKQLQKLGKPDSVTEDGGSHWMTKEWRFASLGLIVLADKETDSFGPYVLSRFRLRSPWRKGSGP